MNRGREPGKRGERRRHQPRVQLDIDQIVDTAMAIADEDGPEAMTMRAIAAKIGVGVMSLYWYVPNKRELEALVLDRLMLESSPPRESTGNWREDLASMARASRRGVLNHPWMVDMLSSGGFVPEQHISHGMLTHMENTMRMVEGLPFGFVERMSISRLVDNFTMGFTVDEVMERRRLASLGMTEDELHESVAPRMISLLDEGDYPMVQHFMAHDHELPNKDQQFEHAMQILLDGIEVQIERAGTSRKK